MHERELLQQILDTVPQWYRADHGPVRHELEVHGERLTFFSHAAFTPLLQQVCDLIQSRMETWADSLPEVVALRDLSSIRREIVIAWLRGAVGALGINL